MKLILLLLAILFLSFNSFSQSAAKNSLYFELGGAAGLYSFNYERMIRDGAKVNTNMRVGFGAVPFRNRTLFVDWDIKNVNYAVPIDINFVFGNKKGHFEASLGYTLVKNGWVSGTAYWSSVNGVITERSNDVVIHREFNHYLSPKISYRYQKPEGGFLFKVSAMPFILIGSSSDDTYVESSLPFWLGLSFGKAF